MVEGCMDEYRHAEVRPAEVPLAKINLKEERPNKVSVTEVRPDRVPRPALPKALLCELDFLGIELVVSPRVPSGHTLLEYRDVLVVRHAS
jgi:hypothetical protein